MSNAEKNTVSNHIEKKYPQTTEAFKQIQKNQYEMFCKKLHDYGPYNVTLGREIKNENDIHTALTVILVRISDKFQRLLNILFYKKDADTSNEPLIDSFKDLGVYAIIAEIINDNKWNK
jgi:hypothetical protein